jgi:hypothetical protein
LKPIPNQILKITSMKLIKVTPNNGRGSIPVYLNSEEILRIDFGSSEHNPGCDITLKNGNVLSVFDKPKSIFDAVNSAHYKAKENTG